MEYKKVTQQINNIVNDNLKKLEQLFPDTVKDGEVDFEALKEELGNFEEVQSEKYELTWAGKQNAKKIAQEDVVGKTLKFIPEDSIDADTTENLYIEGENLEVLKLIRQNYYGTIKMIYIDPPYNTGNDFIYKDDFTITKNESDLAEGAIGENERYTLNPKSQNRFHANWLNMMYPRLKLAKELLKDDGVIFASIDDNEFNNLQMLFNEIFGEENLICNFIVASNSTKNNSKYVSVSHEYILCYAKAKYLLDKEWKVKKNNVDEYSLRAQQLIDRGLTHEDIHTELLELVKYPRFYDLDHYTYADERGIYQTDNPGGVTNGNMNTEVIHPITLKPCQKPNGGWRYCEEEMQRLIKEKLFAFGKDETIIPRPKRYLKDYIYQVPKSLMFFDSQSSTKWLKSNKLPFDFPKAVELIQHLISMVPDNEIILDFFSGSGTTAHAMFNQNVIDKKRRKFILVQRNEECEKNKEGFEGIPQLARKRIGIAGDIIKQSNKDLSIDVGFKAFKLSESNIKWNLYNFSQNEQITNETLNQNPDQMDFVSNAKDIDIVYELMLRQNDVSLSASVEILSHVGERTYLYANSYLVCLETKITEVLVDKLAAIDPLPIKFIFRDSAFGDNIALKDETFRRLKALVEKNSGNNKKTYTVEFI